MNERSSQISREQAKKVVDIWKQVLGLPAVDFDRNFADLGGTSLLANQLVSALARSLQIEVPVIRIFEYPTLRQFTAYLCGDVTENASHAPRTQAASAIRGDGSDNDIAIVGMACRFPGAPDLQTYWDNLVAGRDTIQRLSDDEISPSVAREIRDDPRYVRAAGLIDDPYGMDAAFFDVYPREAALTDPQHRVLLETTWHAFEDAGIAPGRAGRSAVFAGTEDNSYYKTEIAPYPTAEARAGRFSVMTANEKDFVALQIAYKLDLRGPAVSVHTACSTSLVAVIMACRSLRTGECDTAVAGGASVHFPTPEGYYFQEGGVFSSDGRCRPFDSQAEGTVFTDGVGVVVLKRLADAQRDGNTIYAVVKGGAINNDGAAKISFSAPSVSGQAACIREALDDARVDPATLSYVETHGTATPVGDPIELEGLRQAFGPDIAQRQFCGIGSVKSNIGHTTAAAGVASLIKVALAMRHDVIPATLHYKSPNPALNIEQSPFYVVDRNLPWPRGEQPRRAGLSSFGIGGTNSHVILEEAPAAQAVTPTLERPFEILPVAAKTDTARDRLLAAVEQDTTTPVRDLAHTLQSGRTRFPWRGSVVRLPRWPQGHRTVQEPAVAMEAPPLVFLFPGQGSQYIGMGRSLSAEIPEFREVYTRCCAEISQGLGIDFEKFIGDPSNSQTLEDTRYTQPALFAIEVSLGRLFLSWGIHPDFMVGHSVGEFAAACLAGVFTMEEGARLITARGRVMADLPRGRMLSARGAVDAVLAAAGETVDVASINSPIHCVLAGPDEQMSRVQARLEAAGIACRALHTSHAFHSSMMDPAVEPFLEVVRSVKLQAPHIPIISSVTGQPMSAQDATRPEYWASHLRSTVKFSPALLESVAKGGQLFVELGPRTTLSTLASQQFPKDGTPRVAISVLEESSDEASELGALGTALARMWSNGYELDWQRIWPGGQLATSSVRYPFEHKEFRFSKGRAPEQRTAPVQTAATAPAAAPAPMAPANAPASAPVGPAATAADSGASGAGLATLLEHELAALFGEFAGIEFENRSTRFVEAGFDSLVLMQIGVELGKRYGVSVSLGDLMRTHNTLSKLGAHLLSKADPERMKLRLGVNAAPAAGVVPAAPAPAAVLIPGSAAVSQQIQQAQAGAFSSMPSLGLLQTPGGSQIPLTATSAMERLVELQLRHMREIFELQLRQLGQVGSPGPGSPSSAGASGSSEPDARDVAAMPVSVPAAPRALASPGAGAAGGSGESGLRTPLAPLSLMQERIRFVEELQPGRAVYSIPAANRLTGALDAARLAEALRAVVAHQPSLRTVVAQGAQGGWQQRVLDTLEFRLPYEDLSGLPVEARQRELEQQMSSLADQPFELDRAPLFRAALWKVDDQDHVLLFVPHHLIWDGWSFDVLYNELAQAYAALAQGQIPAWSPLAADYRDFARWQRHWHQGPECTAQLNFWRSRYAQLSAPHPAQGRPTGLARSGRAGVLQAAIPGAMVDKLRIVARQANSSLNMLMTAVYAEVVREFTGSDDVVLGLVVRGRRQPEYENVMGFFNNLLPMPMRMNGAQSFASWLDQVGGLLTQAYENQDIAFEALSADPDLARWAAQAGMPYHALISYQDARGRVSDWSGLKREPVSLPQASATEDLGLWVTEHAQGVDLRLIFDSDIVALSGAQWVSSRVLALCEQISRDAGTTLAQLAGGSAQGFSSTSFWLQGAGSRPAARPQAPNNLPVAANVQEAMRGNAAAFAASPDLTATEQVFAQVWQNLLRVPRIRPQDNFFELGGTSLQAMQAVTELEKRLGQPVSARKMVVESLRTLAREYSGTAPGTPSDRPALPMRPEATALVPAAHETASARRGVFARLGHWLAGSEAPRHRGVALAPGQDVAASPVVRAAPQCEVPCMDSTAPAVHEPTARALATTATPPRTSPTVMPAESVRRMATLSLVQKSALRLAQTDPAFAAAQIHAISLEIHGPIDPDVLRASLQDLVDRHDALRARVSEDQTAFAFSEQLRLDVPIMDLSSRSVAERSDEVHKQLRKFAEAPFDLQAGPLFRAALMRLDEADWTLVFACQVLAVDGWSLNVILEDLPKLYAARISGAGPASLPATASFFDYLGTVGLREREGAQASLDYWRTIYPSGAPTLELALDFPRPRRRDLSSKRMDHRVPPDVLQGAVRSGAQAGCSAFVSLLSAFGLFLSRISAQNDLVIGVPAAGQLMGSRQPIVGNDTRVLPLRCSFNDEDTFLSCSGRVMDSFLAALDHQALGLNDLAAGLDLPTDPSRAPLASVMFSFDSGFDMAGLKFGGHQAHHRLQPRAADAFEIAINAAIEGDELVLECTYSTALFTDATIKARLEQMEELLRSIGRDPEAPVGRLSLLPEAQIDAMEQLLNNTGRAYDSGLCVDELIGRTVAARADQTAVEDGSNQLSYAVLWARSGQIADFIVRSNLGPRPLIGLMLTRSADMVAVMLGVWRAGGAFVPLDPAFPVDRLQYMVDHSRVSVILGNADSGPQLGNARFVDVSTIAGPASGELASVPLRQPSDVAYVLYTSGSTGLPKGVQVPHCALNNFLQSMLHVAPGLTAQDRLLAITTLSFDIAQLEIWLPLVAGATTVIASRAVAIDGRALARMIHDQRITVLQATPSTWRLLIVADWEGQPGLTALCGGEAMTRDLADELIPRVKVLWNMYGPTETTVWSTMDRVDTGPLSIGRPIANTQVYILDEQGVRVPQGCLGELWIGGDGVAVGYLGRDDLTSERFVSNRFTGAGRMYRTGDVVRLRADGRIEYVGRNDFQVKINGYRIELPEVQQALAKHGAIKQAVVAGRTRSDGEAALVAYYTIRAGSAPVQSQMLREHMSASLPDYMVPRHYVQLSEFPQTQNGKVDLKSLPDPFRRN